MDDHDLTNRFHYHPPATENVKVKHEDIRNSCLTLANFINEALPEGREKSLAITKLEEVMFWSNASIARSH